MGNCLHTMGSPRETESGPPQKANGRESDARKNRAIIFFNTMGCSFQIRIICK